MTGKYQQPRTIRDVIQDVSQNKWILPNIQRKFVWDKERICDLFDSIMRHYPIGTFMIWKVKGDLIHKTKFFTFLQHYQQKWQETCNDYRPMPNQNEVYAVIDGQQRINSLYIGLLGSYAEKLPRKWWKNAYDPSIQPKEVLFLNIIDKADEIETSRLYDFRFFSKEKFSKLENQYKWFKVGKILELPYIEPENLYYDNIAFEEMLNNKNILKRIPESEKPIALRNLKKLYMVIWHGSQMNYYQEEIQDLDTVVDIFVRANSGGVPLAFSDLVMSVTVSQWPEARDEIDNLVKLIFVETGFSVDRDFILKNCLILFSKDIKFRVKNFTESFINEIKLNFEKISSAILKTCKFIRQTGINDNALRSKYALIPIIYYVYKNNLDINNLAKYKEDKNKIVIWLKMALLKGMFGGQPDSILPKLRELINLSEGCFPTEQIVQAFKNTPKDITIDKDFIIEKIENTHYGSSEAYLILSLITEQDPQFEYHVDHMHPKKLFISSKLNEFDFLQNNQDLYDFYVDKGNWNTLGNLQLLNSRENESKNGKPLELWFEENTNYNKDLYFVPKDDENNYILGFDQFKEFVLKRRNLMINAILKKISSY